MKYTVYAEDKTIYKQVVEADSAEEAEELAMDLINEWEEVPTEKLLEVLIGETDE